MDKFALPENLSQFKSKNQSESEGRPILWLALATGLTLVLSFVPYAQVVTYPIRLFVTFIHESSHALAAVLTLGSVSSLTVDWDGSGLTYTKGGLNLLISSAGYLGTTLFGALLLLLAQRESRARYILSGCGALVLAVTVFFINGNASWLIILLLGLAVGLWIASLRPSFTKSLRLGMMGGSAVIVFMLVAFWVVTHTLFTWVVGLTLAAALLALGNFTRPAIAHFLVNFLAVQCCLNALVDIKTLFLISTSSNQHTDALNMQQMTGIPAVAWSVLWGVIALGILLVTLWIVQRQVVKKST